MKDGLISEKSVKGHKGYSLPECDVPLKEINDVEKFYRQTDANLPEVSEPEVIRHFVHLSKKNYGVDSGFYPLGSCTMKYNPKINEVAASLDGFLNLHPYQPNETVQGALHMMYELEKQLEKITGMDAISLQPAAGAHGELTGLMIMRAYHQWNNQPHRKKIIIPDSAHGTNPASAAMAGFEIVEVKTTSDGLVDLDALRAAATEDIAGLMLTNPSTLGLFENNIKEIADIIHQAGGFLYYDGANMNAIIGVTNPGIMGFDIVHLNLHKTFSTPHGGGGPGAGPIGVKKNLEPFLPKPVIEKKGELYAFNDDRPLSIGKVKAFYGNFGILLRAYTYILTMGEEGLRQIARTAVLNANYMMKRLMPYYKLAFDRICMHEFVLTNDKQKLYGIRTLDIAKRLLDFGYHPPTIYFPLIVNEAMMIEPTETETKATLDAFVEALIRIHQESMTNPDLVKNAPYNTPVRRLDEAGAAKNPVLNCCSYNA